VNEEREIGWSEYERESEKVLSQGRSEVRSWGEKKENGEEGEEKTVSVRGGAGM